MCRAGITLIPHWAPSQLRCQPEGHQSTTLALESSRKSFNFHSLLGHQTPLSPAPRFCPGETEAQRMVITPRGRVAHGLTRLLGPLAYLL